MMEVPLGRILFHSDIVISEVWIIPLSSMSVNWESVLGWKGDRENEGSVIWLKLGNYMIYTGKNSDKYNSQATWLRIQRSINQLFDPWTIIIVL